MDDVFSILIYIIVIISFLSSLFKKKKTPDTPPAQQTRVPQHRLPEEASTVDQSVKEEAADYDILREIEKMFKSESEIQREVPSKQQEAPKKQTLIERAENKAPVSYEDYVLQESFRTESEQQLTKSEHQYQDQKPKQRIIDKKVEEQAKRFEEILVKKSTRQELAVQKLVQKIKNPETFREYILVAEILARPKALRR